MDHVNAPAVDLAYQMLLLAEMSIPVAYCLRALLFVSIVILYKFLEMHFVQDLLTGFRGQPVRLTFSTKSQLYQEVVSKCRILHGRYLSTPWLCSPHLQTVFLTYYGNSPDVEYIRELFLAPDGGTVALDWVMNAGLEQKNQNPIVMIVPGLTSHSNTAYVKHFANKMAKSGRNVVVINHRGLGGVSLTSDWFYHGAWTGDIHAVVKHLNLQYPDAPLFLLGTSIGANLLVFYLGEDGTNIPIVGAAAICCPWDPLICDRFLSRGIIQRVYSEAIAKGLRAYANLHKAEMTRFANWEGIEKTRYIRDFDNSASRCITDCKTVDTYYRRGCSTNVLGNVMVPLLCISSLDDPICTREAIPWDECRLNDNVVLATTEHGGHLPYFEGLRGTSLWWVRAVDEFFSVLNSRNHSNHVKKEEDNMSKEQMSVEDAKTGCNSLLDAGCLPKQDPIQVAAPDKKHLNQLSLWNYKSLWLLAYRTICTVWPIAGFVLALFFRKKFKNLFSSASLTRS